MSEQDNIELVSGALGILAVSMELERQKQSSLSNKEIFCGNGVGETTRDLMSDVATKMINSLEKEKDVALVAECNKAVQRVASLVYGVD